MTINTKKEKRTNAHCRTMNTTRKKKNVENETHTHFDLEYGGKHSKTWNIRNAHYMSWIIAINK
jgi:hypothetical protein